MKRRNFAQSMLIGLAASSVPMGVSLAKLSKNDELTFDEQLSTEEGLKLTLLDVVHPTQNKDRKQLILTYQVDDVTFPLQEKIHHLMADGRSQAVYLTPVGEHQLQAIFNWRLNA